MIIDQWLYLSDWGKGEDYDMCGFTSQNVTVQFMKFFVKYCVMTNQ